MADKSENNLHECLLALRRNQLSSNIRDQILAVGALPWVTLDLVPNSLRLVFLSAKDQRRVAELADFLKKTLPEHVSYQLVESFHGVDAVVRGQLPSGWVPLKITTARQFVGDAVEFEITPVQRFRWRDVPTGNGRPSGSHFSPCDPRVEEALADSRSLLRFLYNPTRLPIFPVYALIEPDDGSGDSETLLSNLALSRFAEPIRDLFRISERKEDSNAKLLDIFRKKNICGLAVCEFMDFPRNGHEFQHSLEQFHAWRNDVLKEQKGIRDIYCLPFIATRESYEASKDPDLVLRIKDLYPEHLLFANPGYVEAREKNDHALGLPVGDLVICGTSKSGRSVLASWICNQFLAAEYSVVYVAVTNAGADLEDHPTEQISASLLDKIASEAGSVIHSRPGDVRDFLSASQAPLAIYTEIREDWLLGEEPDLIIDWQKRSSTGNLFVIFDEIFEGELTWVDRLPPEMEGKLHLGFVCRVVDKSPPITKLALDRATVIIKNLEKRTSFQRPPNFDLAKSLFARETQGAEPLVPIKIDEVDTMHPRNFVLFPRPQGGIVVPPVRGYLSSFNQLNRPFEKIFWTNPPGAHAESHGQEEIGAQESHRANDPQLFDVFISHASEDKPTMVELLVKKLKEHGIRVWYDSEQIQWGEVISRKVNEGLRRSRFVIVVLSRIFVQKEWAKTELEVAFNKEASTGIVRVLPLLVGDKEDQKYILEQYDILSHKSHLIWDGTGENVIQALRSILKKSG